MQSAKSRTWRLQSVPRSWSLDDLRLTIEKSLSSKHPTLSIVQLSLAADDDHYSTATVTFNNDPPEWVNQAPGSFSVAAPAGDSTELYFDTEFDGFTSLYTPPRDVECTSEIIAVPGLAGHALGSWKCSGGSSVWLRDFLPRAVPSARILIYGYDSKLQQKVRKDTLRDLARTFFGDLKALQSTTRPSRCPIILLGHSLGGLIVKESVTLGWADLSPIGLRLFKRFYAMMTFGAPNLGLRNEGLLSVVKGQLNEELIRNLVVTSESGPTEVLKILNDHFLRATRVQQMQLMVCYERESSPLIEAEGDGKLVKSVRRAILVTEHSATHVGRQTEEHEQRAIAQDHSQMVKYRTPNDKDYKFIASVLKNWDHDGHLAVQARFVSGNASRQRIDFEPDNTSKQADHVLQPVKPRALTQINDSDLSRSAIPTRNDLGSSLAQPDQDAVIRSLSFEGMYLRKDNIKSAAQDTCKWLPEHDSFENWIHGRTKLPWISGKPGSGKSVLMDYMVNFCNESYGDDLVVFHFYFHGRGSELQHSAAGLMRSLCHQLVCSDSQCLHELWMIYRQRCKQNGGILWTWGEKELRLFFEHYITVVNGKRKLILVDALDEAGRETAVELVGWFKSLIERASNDLSVCFSCRHYPVIHIDQSSQIVVENCNGSDIKIWVIEQLRHASSDITFRDIETVTSAILSRARGVFLWAALIVPKVVYSFLDGASLADTVGVVNETPVDLREVYERILEHDENASKREFQKWLFIWLCFSPVLLTLNQLVVALDLTVTDFHRNDYGVERFKRKLRAVSNGLCEVVTRGEASWARKSIAKPRNRPVRHPSPLSGKVPEFLHIHEGIEQKVLTSLEREVEDGHFQEIQLIHQSVKDFFQSTGLVAIEPSLAEEVGLEGNATQRLAQVCIGFLQRCMTGEIAPTWVLENFKEYCKQNLHTYVGLADRHGVDQAQLLQTLQWPDTVLLTKLSGGRHKNIVAFALEAEAPSLISAISQLDWASLSNQQCKQRRQQPLNELVQHVCLNSSRYTSSIFKHPDVRIRNRGPLGDTWLTIAIKVLESTVLDKSILKNKTLLQKQEVILAIKLLLEHPQIEIDALDHGSRFTALDLAQIFQMSEVVELIQEAKRKREAH